jgi:hypothetical protein
MRNPTAARAVPMCAVWLSLAVGGPVVLAQQQPSPQPPRSTPPAAGNRINVDRLPLDLERIERQLRKSGEQEEFNGLRLRYFVDVYGKAPRIELFAPNENLTTGPVPWGAPTHREMVEQVTPKEFRSPPMDLNAVMRWLSDKIGK